NQRARSGLLGRLRGGACWRCGWWAAGQVVKTAVHKASQARARGQWLGRCRVGRGCGRGRRGGGWSRGRGGGGGRASAWRAVAVRVAAARSRLWQIAASRHQAALAGNQPDGWWAQGPSIRSDQTVSQMAWRRWVMSASVVGSLLVVKNGW